MIYNAKYIKQFLLKQGMEKPKLRWSYFELPGFVQAKWPATGYIPINREENNDADA